MKRTVLVVLVAMLATSGIVVVGCGGSSASSSGVSNDVQEFAPDSQSGSDAEYVDETLTSRETRYLDGIAADSQDIGQALGTIAELSPQYPFWSDTETIQIGGAVATFTVTYRKWRHRSAPSDRFSRLRQLWIRCLASFDKSGGAYARGVDSADVDLILKANRLMIRGASLAKKTTREIKYLNSMYGY